MPELPEVETTARVLRARLVGCQVLGARDVDWPRMLPNATPDALNAAVRGRVVMAVGRRGKYLLLEFDHGASLAIHRKMSGNLLLGEPSAPAPPHTHLTLDLADAPAPGRSPAAARPSLALRLVDPRKFGRVYLFATREEREAFFHGRLGPDPLADLDPAHLARLVSGRRGRIKSLLLNQRFLAGVGNLYADEALWEARIHPLRRADSLSSEEAIRLANAISRVLQRAIERRGTSFSDFLDANGEPGQNQAYLNVYGRGPSPGHAALPCPRCGQPIARLVLGQRSSHYCPGCQPLPRPARPARGAP